MYVFMARISQERCALLSASYQEVNEVSLVMFTHGFKTVSARFPIALTHLAVSSLYFCHSVLGLERIKEMICQ